MSAITIFINEKPVMLTDDEELYFAPPAHHYKSYVYCKAKTEEDIKRIITICEKDEKLETALMYHTSMDELRKMFWDLHTVSNAAGGVVINEKNEVLLIHRKGKWDLPKGKAEANETIEQTAIREVQEETGLQDVTIHQPICITYHTYKEADDKILKINHWYEMKASSTQALQPQINESISAVKWVPKNEMKNFITATYLSLQKLMEKYSA
jgi:ADP-ribose pyrophosphatase YjhB (NUDIX family)